MDQSHWEASASLSQNFVVNGFGISHLLLLLLLLQLLLHYIHLTTFFQDNLRKPAPER